LVSAVDIENGQTACDESDLRLGLAERTAAVGSAVAESRSQPFEQSLIVFDADDSRNPAHATTLRVRP
jgi:hypothetical protein